MKLVALSPFCPSGFHKYTDFFVIRDWWWRQPRQSEWKSISIISPNCMSHRLKLKENVTLVGWNGHADHRLMLWWMFFFLLFQFSNFCFNISFIRLSQNAPLCHVIFFFNLYLVKCSIIIEILSCLSSDFSSSSLFVYL